MTDRLEAGFRVFGEVYGPDAEAGVRSHVASGTFGAEQARFAMEWAFGSIWARDGLERKLRSCAVLGMVMALKQADEITYHTKMALKNGLTRAEIEEVFLTSVPYCGLPASNVAKAAILKAFAELDG
jgi:alkylhydroperoxidase/carboxymuconolactone decarboxylase family protein YurZ